MYWLYFFKYLRMLWVIFDFSIKIPYNIQHLVMLFKKTMYLYINTLMRIYQLIRKNEIHKLKYLICMCIICYV